MSFKKKNVAKPMYEEFKDTPFITQNRELQNTAYQNMNTALDNYQQFYNNPNVQQSVIDAYNNVAWNDLNRNYQQAMNRNAAREYNRFGTNASSSGLYNTDSLQRNYNDQASRIASNTAQYRDSLINNEINRRLGNAQVYNTLWNQAGETAYAHDKINQNVRWLNQDRKWENDVAKNNTKGSLGSTISGAVSGAAQGFLSGGGPWGALAGAVAGGAAGYFGSANGQDTSNAGNIGGSIGSLFGSSGGGSQGSLQGSLSDSTNNIGSYMGGAYRW